MTTRLADDVDGLYKNRTDGGPRLAPPGQSWVSAEWIDWFEHGQLCVYCPDMPPAEGKPPLQSTTDFDTRRGLKLEGLGTRPGRFVSRTLAMATRIVLYRLGVRPSPVESKRFGPSAHYRSGGLRR